MGGFSIMGYLKGLFKWRLIYRGAFTRGRDKA